MKGGPTYSADSATAEHVAEHVDPAVICLQEALADPRITTYVRDSIHTALCHLEFLS